MVDDREQNMKVAKTNKVANINQKSKKRKPQRNISKEPELQEIKPQDLEPQEPMPQQLEYQEAKPQESKPQETKAQELEPQKLEPQEPEPQEPEPQELKPQEPKAQEPSFAPVNHKFQPPTGVDSFLYFGENFKFRPLSPFSAEKFMMQAKTQDIAMATVGEPSVAEQQLSSDHNSEKTEEEGSGKFRKCVANETARLQGLCSNWEKESDNAEPPLTEEGE